MIGNKRIGECKTCAALRDEISFLRKIVERLTGQEVAEIKRPDVIAAHVEQAIAEEETHGEDAAVYGDD